MKWIHHRAKRPFVRPAQGASTSNPRQSTVGNIAHGGPTSVLPTDGTQREKQNGQWLDPSTFWYSPVVNQRWRFGAYPDPTAGRPLVNHRSPDGGPTKQSGPPLEICRNIVATVPTVEPGSFQRSCDPTVKPPLRRWEGGVENPHQLTNLNQSKNVARWCMGREQEETDRPLVVKRLFGQESAGGFLIFKGASKAQVKTKQPARFMSENGMLVEEREIDNDTKED
ncbi:hypothetical protein PCASD_25549, partial [Puccinia coronata f. sp. avenae]